jgi:hypothetical protein
MAVTVCVTYKHICIRTASTGWTGFTSPCGCSSRKDEQPEELEAVLRPQDVEVEDRIHYLAHVGDEADHQLLPAE